ncbi:MAG: VWA domain-containing protein [Chloroflexota bacterium]
MTFAWPQALLALALIPLGFLVLRAVDRRRGRKVAAFAGGQAFGAQGASGTAAGSGGTAARRGVVGRAKRTIPGALIVAGLVVMVIALARPQGTIDVPRQEGTVILAFDISASMGATDLQPTRMAAAVSAATDFVHAQPASVIVGVVAFSDSGISVQQPTNDQDAVIAALGRLRPQRGTSLARGIDASLTAIARAAAGPNVDYYTNRSPEPTATPTPVPPGTHAPAVIVLLSDGENNQGPDPFESVQVASDRGVRIYTVGIGSESGATLDLEGFQVHTQLDAATLRTIADRTGGSYYGATDAATLDAIYGQIDTAFVVRPEQIELTGLFAAVSLALLVAGAVLSFAFSGRLP